MSNARDKANIPALNFSSTGIDDNADSAVITLTNAEDMLVGTAPDRTSNLSQSSGNVQIENGLIFDSGSSSIDNQIMTYRTNSLVFATSATERMRINSTGVGIGTSSPANNLHIHTDVSGEGILVKSTGNTYNEIIADANRTGSADTLGRFRGNWNTNPVAFISINTGDDTTNKDDGRIIFSTSSSGSSPTERMRIQPNGNVGIGTSSPAHNVEIVATNSGSINDTLQIRNNTTTTGSGSRLRFITSTDLNSDTNGASIASVRNGNDNDLVFEVENSEAKRIDHAGNVGIGTTSPTDTLSIGSFDANGASTGINLGSGSLIQTSISSTSSLPHVRFKNPNGQVGQITTSGSSTTYSTSSDYRLKENVSYDFDATTRLKQLKPARFNFIADADTTVDGFLAHEVSSIVPEAITGTKDAVDEDGNPEYQGIDQSKLVPLLVKTIQELEARITALETNQP